MPWGGVAGVLRVAAFREDEPAEAYAGKAARASASAPDNSNGYSLDCGSVMGAA
jgi:hypothetical protein